MLSTTVKVQDRAPAGSPPTSEMPQTVAAADVAVATLVVVGGVVAGAAGGAGDGVQTETRSPVAESDRQVGGFRRSGCRLSHDDQRRPHLHRPPPPT